MPWYKFIVFSWRMSKRIEECLNHTAQAVRTNAPNKVSYPPFLNRSNSERSPSKNVPCSIFGTGTVDVLRFRVEENKTKEWIFAPSIFNARWMGWIGRVWLCSSYASRTMCYTTANRRLQRGILCVWVCTRNAGVCMCQTWINATNWPNRSVFGRHVNTPNTQQHGLPFYFWIDCDTKSYTNRNKT